MGVPPMETAYPTQSPGFGKSPSGPFRGLLADAIRFWEPRRLVYIFVLTAVAGCLARSDLAPFPRGIDATFASAPCHPCITSQCLLLRRLPRGHSNAALIS